MFSRLKITIIALPFILTACGQSGPLYLPPPPKPPTVITPTAPQLSSTNTVRNS